jgi:hypothetical protein
LFGYIHTLSGRQGAVGAVLMNVMLASGGYPWTVIRVEDRNSYLAALDRASIDLKIEPFAGFIAERVRRFHEADECESARKVEGGPATLTNRP